MEISAYTAAIFTLMNELMFLSKKEKEVEGKGINVFKTCENLNAFNENLHPWCERMKIGSLSSLCH